MFSPRLAYLFKKQLNHRANPVEQQELRQLMTDPDYQEQVEVLLRESWNSFAPGTLPFSPEQSRAMLENILQSESDSRRITTDRPARILQWSWRRWAVAASIIVILLPAIYLFVTRDNKKQELPGAVAVNVIGQPEDIEPGNNKAVLTLSDGKQIVLDSSTSGLLARQGSANIEANNGSRLQYQGGNAYKMPLLINTLSTPRGGQYQLQLSDGTEVWLNASSSIRFPAVFPSGERRVEITGEAYFEVAHRQTGVAGTPEPFKVIIRGAAGKDGVVEVLGTHFNINAYPDEPVLRTTLLEGSVKFSRNGHSVIMKPGEQTAVNEAGDIRLLTHADVDKAVAWKNGIFSFDGSDVESVMRQVARWYDVQVVYEGPRPLQRFGGDIARSSNLSQVLQMLRNSGMHFRVEDRKVIVTK